MGVAVEIISKLLSAGLLLWFALLAMLIAVRILRRDIDVSGFLTNSTKAGRDEITPERVAAMAAFPTILIYYVLTALRADMSVSPAMPDIPELLVTILTGSNALYLAGKIARS